VLDPRTAGRALLGALATAQGTLAAAGPGGPPPLVAAELERSIVTALLLGQPHTYSPALRAAPVLPAPRVVDAALARAAATPASRRPSPSWPRPPVSAAHPARGVPPPLRRIAGSPPPRAAPAGGARRAARG
jgi:hypothetical protein